MDKRLILTIVLVSAVFLTGNFVMSKLYPPVEIPAAAEVSSAEDALFNTATTALSLFVPVEAEEGEGTSSKESSYIHRDALYEITFSSQGATMQSLKLRDFHDPRTKEPIELVLPFNSEPVGAFTLYFPEDNTLKPLTANFTLIEQRADALIFAYDFQYTLAQAGESQAIRLLKEFHFNEEYLFKVNVAFIALDDLPLPQALLTGGYTLEGLPQLGPDFERLDGRDAFRHPIYLNADRKRVMAKMRAGVATANDGALWAGISEKYFLLLGIPQNAPLRMHWGARFLDEERQKSGLQFNVTRGATTGRMLELRDEIFYYMGPKQEAQLLRYNIAKDNAWGVSDLYLNRAMDAHVFLGVIITPLKWILFFIYGFVGNWGWAIVILTVLVKLLLLKPSISSAVSMSSMTKVQPKLKALQEKYKDNKEELARKQMELYQKEGVNPAGGCLPMLIQLPILLALFSLFNQYFELRGAPWILWVQDLSSPDKFITFSRPLPLLGWNYLNLLPIFYIATQMLTTFLSMNDTTANNQQMRTMMWLLPLIFFFMLYNMPSGLFLYWTVSNILGLFQQLLINHWKKDGTLEKMHAKKEAKKRGKNQQRAQLMAAYQQRLNQSKGKKK